jgi:hypothetical protein
MDATTVVHGKNDKSRMGGYFILEYDRDIYKNIDYLSGSVTCRSFGKTRETKINIYDAVFRKNGSISAKSLNNLTHQVKIPNTFEPLLWHPAPTYIPDRVWFCDKDKQVYH